MQNDFNEHLEICNNIAALILSGDIELAKALRKSLVQNTGHLERALICSIYNYLTNNNDWFSLHDDHTKYVLRVVDFELTIFLYKDFCVLYCEKYFNEKPIISESFVASYNENSAFRNYQKISALIALETIKQL